MDYSLQNSIVRQIVDEKKGEILSKPFTNMKEIITVKCCKGHIINMTPFDLIRSNNYCLKCSSNEENKDHSLSIIKSPSRGRNHHSKRSSKLRGSCENIKYSNVQNRWFNSTSENDPILSFGERLAQENGCILLSTYIVNNDTMLRWSCLENGHEFIDSINNLNMRISRFCPMCFNENNVIKGREIARLNGGSCLSDSNTKTSEFRWLCKNNHIFTRSLKELISEPHRYCLECLNDKSLLYNEACIVANSYGGKCIRESIIDASDLTFECKRGHRWNTSLYKVKYLKSW